MFCLRTTSSGEKLSSRDSPTATQVFPMQESMDQRKAIAFGHLMNKKLRQTKKVEDVNREIERYSKIAASGFNAYEEDRLHEKQRREDMHHLQEIDAKKAARHACTSCASASLLSQYGKIASAGFPTEDSKVQDSRPDELHPTTTAVKVLSPTGHWRSVTIDRFEHGTAQSKRLGSAKQEHYEMRSDHHGPSGQRGKTTPRGRWVDDQEHINPQGKQGFEDKMNC
eukprot:766222-Hanusia_phi.AAC.2